MITTTPLAACDPQIEAAVASFNTVILEISLPFKSDCTWLLSRGTPSTTNKGERFELIEVIPRITYVSAPSLRLTLKPAVNPSILCKISPVKPTLSLMVSPLTISYAPALLSREIVWYPVTTTSDNTVLSGCMTIWNSVLSCKGTSKVFIPIKVTSRAVTLAGIRNVKRPSISVTVPVDERTTRIVAPINDSPLSSTTCPLMVFIASNFSDGRYTTEIYFPPVISEKLKGLSASTFCKASVIVTSFSDAVTL